MRIQRAGDVIRSWTHPGLELDPHRFRYPLPLKMSISIGSSLRLSGTGMTSLNPGFLLLNCEIS